MYKAEVINKALSFKYGGMLREELSYIYDFCKGKDVIALGSMVGMSSYVIASVAKGLYCVDAWSDRFEHLNHSKRQKDVYKNDWLKQVNPNMFDAFRRNCNRFIKSGKIKTIKGKTDNVYTRFSVGMADILLIDADHEYSGVIKDIINYAYTVKENGYLMFHDYGCGTWTGVSEACDQMMKSKQIKLIDKDNRIAVFQTVRDSSLYRVNRPSAKLPEKTVSHLEKFTQLKRALLSKLLP